MGGVDIYTLDILYQPKPVKFRSLKKGIILSKIISEDFSIFFFFMYFYGSNQGSLEAGPF